MVDDEQTMNRYGLPMEDGERGVRSSSAIAWLFIGSIVMVLLSIAVSGQAVVKILKTTPAMGIPVDARGNRIPIQGYPQLWFGLAGIFVFTVFAIVLWLYRAEMLRTSYRRRAR
jgi:hypothetical protein